MDGPVFPAFGAENLFDSVMSEFKHRIKVIPAEPELGKEKESPKKELVNSLDLNSNPNGIAEYKAYSKISDSYEVKSSPEVPVAALREKARESTPTKPQRRKPPIKSERPNIRRRMGVEESHVTSELRDIIDSAFLSDNQPKENLSHAKDVNSSLPPYFNLENGITDDKTDANNSDTLTRDNVSNGLSQYRLSEDSSPSGTADEMNTADGYAADNLAFENQPYFMGYRDDNEEHLETMSMYSVLSNDDSQPSVWATDDEWQNGRRNEDSISLTSFASAEVNLNSKQARSRKANARAKAKMLKKRAAVQKEKMGALLDSAGSKACGKIKNLKKLPGKNKALQSITNKLSSHKPHDHPVITNISLPATGRATGSASDSEESSKAPPPPIRQASLSSISSNVDLIKSNRQVAVKSGYLKKQSRSKIKGWNERWFVIKGDQLHHYKDVDGKYLGSIHLQGCKVETHPVRSYDSTKFIFEIIQGDQKTNNNQDSFVLSASSPSEVESWVKVIKRIILSPIGGGIFGQRLDETVRHDIRLDSTASSGASSNRSRSVSSSQMPPRQVPIIVENCVEFIRNNKGFTEEGLFRLPGQANDVKELQNSYDSGERPTFPRNTDVHTVASLLKGYLRELPEPIIPFERYDNLISTAKLTQSDDRGCQANITEEEEAKRKEEAKRMIKDQVELLPQPNFQLLRYLCRFLDEVQHYSAQNKMDISNLAMVFGPNIMRARTSNPMSMMANASYVQHIMHQFIANHMFFFPDNEKSPRSDLGLIPDVAVDAQSRSSEKFRRNEDNISSTESSNGSVALRQPADDSGTGSMGPTPENTHKRAPPVPSAPPPIRTKPVKPMRRKLNSQHDDPSPPSTVERKSQYDNVTLADTEANKVDVFRSRDDWRSSNGSVDSNITGTHPSSQRSSTMAVAGSVGLPDSHQSITTDYDSVPRHRHQVARPRRVKPARQRSQNLEEEESVYCLPPEDSSNLSKNSDATTVRNHPRSSTYPVMKYATSGRKQEVNDVSKTISRLSMESGSGRASPTSTAPIVPVRSHRRGKKEEGSLRSSVTDSYENETVNRGYERSSKISSTSTTASGRSLTYEEMAEQIAALKDELQKQRLEHEKRSRMLEEHYVMKMKSSASAIASLTNSQYMSYPPATSLASNPRDSYSSSGNERSVSQTGGYKRCSLSDDLILEQNQTSSLEGQARARTMSTDSASDQRYKEEVKRHALTKIKLRNAERGLKLSEERNLQLQKEMEQFYETFAETSDN